jgi:phenylacetic acid degradation operon negative regulatory protein
MPYGSLRKMLRKGLRRDILFLLASLGDLLNDMSYTTMLRRLHYLDYQPPSIQRQLSRMTQIGDLEKVIKNGKPHLRLTAVGNERLKENVSLFAWQERKWDGWWRLVIFDIKEEKRYRRDWLRRKLESLGFGQWQKSVYVSPHDLMDEVNRFLDVRKLTPMVACLMSKQNSLKKDRDLAYRAWNLDRLWDEYSDFINRWTDDPSGEMIELWAQYQDLIKKDPFLPKKLLPDRWPAWEAYQVYKQTMKKWRQKKAKGQGIKR